MPLDTPPSVMTEPNEHVSPISFIRIFLTATPVIEARPITLPILEGPHKLQPILSETTDLSLHFSLTKTYRCGHAAASFIQRLSVNLQCISLLLQCVSGSYNQWLVCLIPCVWYLLPDLASQSALGAETQS